MKDIKNLLDMGLEEITYWFLDTDKKVIISLLKKQWRKIAEFRTSKGKLKADSSLLKINKSDLFRITNKLLKLFKVILDKIIFETQKETAEALEEGYNTICSKLRADISRLKNGQFTKKDKPKLDRIYKDLMKIYHTDLGGDLEMAQFVNSKIKPLKEI